MTNKLKLLMSAATAAALLAPAATAWEDDQNAVYIDQVQLGDVFSEMTVWVDDVEGDVAVGSNAIGNTSAATVMSGDVTYEAYQTMHGDTIANTELEGGSVDGAAYASSTAYANASTAGTWDGNTQALAHQTNIGLVAAETEIDLEYVGKIGTSTTAIANVSTPSSEYGDNRSFSSQDNNGSVIAVTDVELYGNEEEAHFATLAGGNAVTSSGSSSTVINGAVQTNYNSHAEILAESDVYIHDAANVSSSSTAAANSYTLSNEYGYATLGRAESPLYQGNDASVSAENEIEVGSFDGYLNASSYGVGNSALIGNVGSDTGLYANQENWGNVSSTASIDGSSFTGGTGVVHSTAIGNASTATLCNVCGDAVLHGSVNQTNAGSIYAGASAHVGTTGNVYGSATAVGNSATFTSSGH